MEGRYYKPIKYRRGLSSCKFQGKTVVPLEIMKDILLKIMWRYHHILNLIQDIQEKKGVISTTIIKKTLDADAFIYCNLYIRKDKGLKLIESITELKE